MRKLDSMMVRQMDSTDKADCFGMVKTTWFFKTDDYEVDKVKDMFAKKATKAVVVSGTKDYYSAKVTCTRCDYVARTVGCDDYYSVDFTMEMADCHTFMGVAQTMLEMVGKWSWD